MTVQTQTPDPYDSASRAEVAPRRYYGQLSVDVWFCGLVKGEGKVPYDPAAHERRWTAVNLNVVPLAEQNVSFEIKRDMIAENREWAGIVLPAIVQAGIDAGLWASREQFSLRDWRNLWVQCEYVGTGRTYRTRQGEERESTTIKVLAIYPDEDTCRAAYYQDTGQTPPEPLILDEFGESIPGLGGPSVATTAPPPPPPADSKERATALEFVKVIIAQHSGDTNAIAAQMAAMPMISKFFTIDSPEVRALLTA